MMLVGYCRVGLLKKQGLAEKAQTWNFYTDFDLVSWIGGGYQLKPTKLINLIIGSVL